MTSKIEVPRELIDRMINALDDEGWHTLADEAAKVLAAPEAPRQSDELDSSAERNAMQRQRDSALSELKRECDDTDEALRLLGFDPEEVRTDGGSLNLSKLRAAPLSPDHSGGGAGMVLPDRREPVVTGAISDFTKFEEARGWNACLDKVKEMNQ
jgi:hypothetical protein